MKLSTYLLSGILSLAVGLPLLSQDVKTIVSTTGKPTKAAATSGETVRDGQTVFAQNCERCHQMPQGFSPRISGTVSRHMQARANLSKADVEALLRFLNP
jgi:cytochrome c2